MGGACSTYGEKKMYVAIWWGIPKGRVHMENLDLNARLLIK
jgi:hypothetical protein